MIRKFTVLICTLATTLIALLAIPAAVGAKQSAYPYTLIDLGTLGGPQAGFSNPPLLAQGDGALPGGSRGAAHRGGRGSHGTLGGVAFGTADTATLDPYANQNGFLAGDPYVQHGFAWRDGVITDLGALGPVTANNGSSVGFVNAQGDAAGFSNNGLIDPNPGLGGMAEIRAVLWKNGQLTDLGTLGGAESVGFDLNGRDQVMGSAATTVADPYSMFGWATQAHAFIWQDGVMHDLGTLGGADSTGWFINDRGQIDGNSYPDATVIPGLGRPAQHPFLWQNGSMRDLGTLPGSNDASVSNLWSMNARGEVVGWSWFGDDATRHAFLWDGSQLVDLGTLGGTNSYANSVGDSGAVVGGADLPDGSRDGFLWTNGHMQDLPPVNGAPCASGVAINAKDVVVGVTTDCHGTELGAVLWKDGSAIDLNALVAPSALRMTFPFQIDNRGQIAGLGLMPDGSFHSFVLVPSKH